jgi:hypothetical protein
MPSGPPQVKSPKRNSVSLSQYHYGGTPQGSLNSLSHSQSLLVAEDEGLH